MRQWSEQPKGEANQSAQAKHSILIDTDIGDDIDDALALALALRSPEIELLGVSTVFGDTRRRAQLAAHVLRVFGHGDVPVAAGLEMPLQLRHQPSSVAQAAIVDSYAEDLCISSITGPELIVQTALAHAGRLSLLCIGPLTNVARAVSMEPRLFMAIKRVILMGGTSGWPFPEWNVRSDARAAQIVLAAGIPVTLLGWNVTRRCQLQEQDIERLRLDTSAEAQLLYQLLSIWRHERSTRLPYLHDPLTVVALCAPELLNFREMTARVLTHGPLKGFMVPRIMNGPLVQAAVDVRPVEVREWVMQRLCATPLPSQTT